LLPPPRTILEEVFPGLHPAGTPPTLCRDPALRPLQVLPRKTVPRL
jgi:hypothetical protein